MVIGSALGGTDEAQESTPAASVSPEATVIPAPAAAAAAAPPPASAPAPAAGIGTPARDGKFEFVVTGVEPGLSVIGTNPYLQKQAQGAYTVIRLSVLNTSDVPKSFIQDSQDLYDEQGRRFSPDSMANIALSSDEGDSTNSLMAEINPGNAIDTTIVYDLPAGAIPDHIELHDSMFSSGVTISLR